MRDDLMKRLHETLPGIETPLMRGDNFALLLCGHFDDGEPNSDNDSGWSDSAENGYNEVIAAIRAHYEPAAARIAELEALVSSEVSQRYRDCAALLARAEAAEAQVAKLVGALRHERARTLEEAAKWVESHRTQSVSAMAVPEPCDKGCIHEGTKYAHQLRALSAVKQEKSNE